MGVVFAITVFVVAAIELFEKVQFWRDKTEGVCQLCRQPVQEGDKRVVSDHAGRPRFYRHQTCHTRFIRSRQGKGAARLRNDMSGTMLGPVIIAAAVIGVMWIAKASGVAVPFSRDVLYLIGCAILVIVEATTVSELWAVWLYNRSDQRD